MGKCLWLWEDQSGGMIGGILFKKYANLVPNNVPPALHASDENFYQSESNLHLSCLWRSLHNKQSRQNVDKNSSEIK